ncbi:tRNA (adenosine(37)-N6)-threonylcarbamoyltransferase complex ATPase subunit type 1 TsaE [Pseudomonas typographi]|uniref:tRNA threonylcarbamoyladenosine biosynthesis protein TsaE n=1 Tax=Pseudomonas typographi TaxID=2715964 RepID=A0ABR7Z649_9PSED|nr:tRNA (adenosine(37)-N6)-threonylcarbamoyltransferase complex ATPase subunit type 1 TsaE [Pseudomonas typographi]MBD1551802.1 tRNA (adenosine(37)-N6)-threonylcarbamoyltransferase complex ATPase subunit type 1 TsaE [Pseudomonas typographi]MBD1600789.1 tRNA (adenosine(37)-N6)-threonylcarbamoyltransferase complex ATPase subunit type 1 TsaE [Pseudomonas typographi]
MPPVTLCINGEEAMAALGVRLGALTGGVGVVFLQGDLGMGKTTLSRGIIRGFGHPGAVKSPTFTLVEPYEMGSVRVYHFDLYRLADPEELEFMGVRDYFDGTALCLVEWAEKGYGVLPNPDIIINISAQTHGRSLQLAPHSARGESWSTALANEFI